jgi:hypothetical protein
MSIILVGEIDLFPPIFLRTGHLYDRHSRSLYEFDILYVLLHLLLLQNVLDSL